MQCAFKQHMLGAAPCWRAATPVHSRSQSIIRQSVACQHKSGCHASPSSSRSSTTSSRRPVVAVYAGRAAAAAAPAVAAAAPLIPPDVVFSAATYIMVPVYAVLILAPHSRMANFLVSSPLLLVLFAVPYAILAVQAWQAGLMQPILAAVASCNPFPDTAALTAIFNCSILTTLAWLHLLLLDFVVARAVLLDGLRHQVPTAHSLVLCFMFGPLGLISHLVTRVVVAATHPDRPKPTGSIASSSMWT